MEEDIRTHSINYPSKIAIMSGLTENFPFGLTLLPPRDKEHFTKTLTSTMKSPALSCWSEFSKKFSKKSQAIDIDIGCPKVRR